MRKPLPQAPPTPPGSLAEALAAVPDPRQPYGWRPQYPPIPLVALLQLAVAATLRGARSLYAIAQWGRERLEDDPVLLESLGIPPGRSPSVATLHRVFKALDVAAFEQVVGQWLLGTGVAPTDPLALDGKICAAYTEMRCPGCIWWPPMPTSPRRWWTNCAPRGRARNWRRPKRCWGVTGDSLLTQREVSERIVRGGGDYLLPVKDNQPSLRSDLDRALSLMGGPRVRPPGCATLDGAGVVPT